MRVSVVFLLLLCGFLLPPAWSSSEAWLPGRVRIGGYEAPLCPQATCRGRCGDRESPVCQCHPTCMMLGDCCLDYQVQTRAYPVAVCRSNMSFMDSNLTAEYEERRQAQELVKPLINNYNKICDESFIDVTPPMRVVSKCPPRYTGHTREACESCDLTNFTIPHIMPVYSRTSLLVFKNEFCAACHGESEPVHIALNVSCGVETRLRAVTWYIENGLENMIRNVQTYRSDSNPFKNGCRFYLYGLHLPLPLWRLEALYSSRDDCRAPLQNEEVMKIAGSYSSPVTRPKYHNITDMVRIDHTESADTKRKFLVHMNWHRVYGCPEEDYVCTRYNFTVRYVEGYPNPAPFLVLRYEQGVGKVYYGQQLLCERHSSMADLLTESCVARTACPEAHVLRHGATCYPVPPLWREDSVQGLHRHTVEIMIGTGHEVNSTALVTLFPALYNILLTADTQFSWEAGARCSELLPALQAPHCILFVMTGISASRLLSVANYNAYRVQLFREISELVGGVRYIGMRNFPSAARLRCQGDGALEWLERPAVVTDAVEDSDMIREDALRVMDQQRGLLYATNMTALYLLWKPAGAGDLVEDGAGEREFVLVKKHPPVAVCVSPTSLLTCHTIELPSTHYKAHPGGGGDAETFSFTLRGGEGGEERVLSLPKSRVLIDSNNTLLTCESLYKRALNSKASKPMYLSFLLPLVIFISFLQ